MFTMDFNGYMYASNIQHIHIHMSLAYEYEQERDRMTNECTNSFGVCDIYELIYAPEYVAKPISRKSI